MKLKFPAIDADVFYTVGKYAFFSIALIGCIRIVDLWSELKSYEVFSSLANVIFYFVLAGFFAHLQKQSMPQTDVDDDEIKQMNEALEQLHLKPKNEKRRTK